MESEMQPIYQVFRTVHLVSAPQLGQRNSAASEVATVAPTVRAAEGKIPEGGSFVRPLIIHGT